MDYDKWTPFITDAIGQHSSVTRSYSALDLEHVDMSDGEYEFGGAAGASQNALKAMLLVHIGNAASRAQQVNENEDRKSE